MTVSIRVAAAATTEIATEIAAVTAKHDAMPGVAAYALAVCATGHALLTSSRLGEHDRTAIALQLREAADLYERRIRRH